MLRRLMPTTFLATQFFFAPHLSPAQSLPPSSSCPCTLQGSVVDSVSGQPIPHALVRLTANSHRATLTGSEGKFQFEGLPAGSVTLQAGKPGYLDNDAFGPWSGTRSLFQFGPGAAPAILKLTPENVISGQVSDENGEPLEGFTVSVLIRAPDNKRLFPDQRHFAVTDDEGKFRIPGMPPGSYFLRVAHMEAPILNSTGKSAAPMGYAPVFYPGANDISSAVPLKLRPGRPAQANFSLKREPYVQLSGTVSGIGPQDEVSSLLLLDSSGTSLNSEISFDAPTSSFRTEWIPPGAYTLIVQAAGVRATHPAVASSVSFANLRIYATSSRSDLHLTLQPRIDVPVIMRGLSLANSENLQSLPLALALIPKESDLVGFRDAVSAVSAQDAWSSGDTPFLFAGVVPGTYQFIAESPSGVSFYAESATWGATDLQRDDLVLSSGSVPPIEVVVRDDGATLNGTVSSGDLPHPSAIVLLAEKRKRTRLVPVNANGRFEVSGLAPGVYRVFAVDASAPFDYEDPAFLAKISSKIQEVTLAPKQSASINLELVTGGE